MSEQPNAHVSREAFKAAVQAVCEILPASASASDVKSLLISLTLDSGSLYLTTRSDATEAEVQLPASGVGFSVTVQAGLLKKALEKSRADTMRLVVTSAKKRGQLLNVYAPDVRPVAIAHDSGWRMEGLKKFVSAVRYPGSVLLDALPYLLQAYTKKDTPNAVCNGLILYEDKIGLTDGHRLHVQPGFEPSPFQAILPEPATLALCQLLQKFGTDEVIFKRFRRNKGDYLLQANFAMTLLQGGNVTVRARPEDVPAALLTVVPPDGTSFAVDFVVKEVLDFIEPAVRAKKSWVDFELWQQDPEHRWLYIHICDPVQTTQSKGITSGGGYGTLVGERVTISFDPRLVRDVLATLGEKTRIVYYPPPDPTKNYHYPARFIGTQQPPRWGLLMPRA